MSGRARGNRDAFQKSPEAPRRLRGHRAMMGPGARAKSARRWPQRSTNAVDAPPPPRRGDSSRGSRARLMLHAHGGEQHRTPYGGTMAVRLLATIQLDG